MKTVNYKVGYTFIAKYLKMIMKCEKRKVYSGVFSVTFFAFRAPFFAFCISKHFAPGLAWKLKGLCGLFFRGFNKTQNLHEMRKVYSECFVFCGVFHKNNRKIPVKCEIRKEYSWPKVLYTQTNYRQTKQFVLGAQLIKFPQIWDEQRTPGASNSLCVRAKNQQISVSGEWYANCSWTAQCRFAVPSTHMRIWFANRLRAVCKPFGTLVYTRLFDYVL